MMRAAALALALPAGQTEAAGFQFLAIPASGGVPSIETAVWYPSRADLPDVPNTPSRQALSLNAPVDGERLPLVVISHGDGGWLGGHAGTALALAEAGFVVAAFNHPGNSDGDETAPPSRWMVERPAHVAQVVNHMQHNWEWAASLDLDRVGLFGFSAGGYTALVASGARPSIDRMSAHCQVQPDEFVCRTGMVEEIVNGGDDALQDLQTPDARISAVVAVAPGFGFAFDAAGLSEVGASVQLWGGGRDERVPVATNIEPLVASLPQIPDVRRVEHAGHFGFMPTCNPALQAANPRVWDMVCVDAPDFDREAFQHKFNAEVVAFLRRALLR
jgi:predicted dienelactone hydrolase